MTTIKILQDTRHQLTNGNYPIKLRVTNQRTPKYFNTGINLSIEGFKKVIGTGRKTSAEKNIYSKLQSLEAKAYKCLDSIGIFTFEQFEKLFFENRGAADSVAEGFDQYIAYLKSEDRYGNASTYRTAINSLSRFKKDLKYIDITSTFLMRYEQFMVRDGKSISSVGMYLRPLKAIFNIAIKEGKVTQLLYPFGRGKYQIPRSVNNKRAFTSQEIKSIIDYKPVTNNEQRSKDFWLFMYLGNGMNIGDMLRLRFEDIDGDSLVFVRQKTQRSNRSKCAVRVLLQKEHLSIIRKYKSPNAVMKDYIFPILRKDMNENCKRNTINSFTKRINSPLKEIGAKLNLSLKFTTYTARHSFATQMKNKSKAPLHFISQSMGHTSLKTTEIYLSKYEDMDVREYMTSLLPE